MLHAQNIAGANIMESMQVDNKTLVLNGAGLREKFVFDVYAAGLYLTAHSSSASDIINKNEFMAIKLHMLRDVSGQDMAEAIFEGFENALAGNTTSLTSEITDFLEIFGDEAANGTVYQLIYVPQQGVNVYINDNIVKTIEGIKFKRALFGIWLGEKPAQQSLKESLLNTK